MPLRNVRVVSDVMVCCAVLTYRSDSQRAAAERATADTDLRPQGTGAEWTGEFGEGGQVRWGEGGQMILVGGSLVGVGAGELGGGR